MTEAEATTRLAEAHERFTEVQARYFAITNAVKMVEDGAVRHVAARRGSCHALAEAHAAVQLLYKLADEFRQEMNAAQRAQELAEDELLTSK